MKVLGRGLALLLVKHFQGAPNLSYKNAEFYYCKCKELALKDRYRTR